MDNAEAKADASKKRAARKGVLTKEINTIMKFIRSGIKEEVEEHRDRLKTKYAAMEEAHEAYHQMLTEDEEIAESDTWFDKVEDSYVSVLAAMNDFFSKDAKAAEVSSQEVRAPKLKDDSVNDISMTNELVSYLNLPKLEIEKYDGDPLKYHVFCATFDEAVGGRQMDATIKLTRLLHNTIGDAHDAISHCMLIGGQRGYQQAREILKNRYGDHYIIADKVIQKLKDGGPVKSAQELLRLSDELNDGLSILSNLDKLQEIDTQSSIVKITDRLQPYLRNRWRRDAMDTKREKSRYPSFQEFVKFVQRAAEDAVDPVYGQQSNHRAKAVKEDRGNKKTSFVTSAGQERRKQSPCILCGDAHRLFYCQKFKDMRPKERLNLVRQRKLCENCLLDNHSVANCRKQSRCSVPGCNARHTKFIHVEENGDNEGFREVTNHQTKVCDKINIVVPTVPVNVNDRTEVSVLLDTASNSTFCSKWLADSLGLEGSKVDYVLNTMSREGEQRSAKVVTLNLKSLDGESSLKLSNVYVVDNIPVNSAEIDYSRYQHLQNLNIVSGDVHVLIGQDHSEALVPLEIRRGRRGDPFAVRTMFGWSANGPALANNPIRKNVTSHFVVSSVEADINRLWDIENDVCTKSGQTSSEADREVQRLWDAQAKLVDGHYEIPIPWKNDVSLPNNIALAEARMRSLCVKLKRCDLFNKYDCEIQALIDKCYAEAVPIYDVNKPVAWYLPHHCVINKKGKFRIVFDCSARFQGESLNQKCYQGPEVNNKLVHVLLRFRENRVAFMADVESMYHQVCVPECDRDALRFLWVSRAGDIHHFRMTRHLFGGVWSGSAATYALRRTVSDFGGNDDLVDDTIINAFYVDDCLKSVSSSDEALHVIGGVTSVLKKGGFRLTKFVSNDMSVISKVPENDRAKECKDLTHGGESKALGVRWNFQDDEFWFDLNIEDCKRINRKKMLSIISTMYDPLGIVSPVLIAGKIILQDATRLKIGWDEEVPASMQQSWIHWLQSLADLKRLRVPRCVKPARFDDSFHELHHFSDASEKAYGSCSYLRSINKCGEINTALVFSKSRVAPIKNVTIPRLELQAALLSARVDAMLRQEMSIELARSYFWSDSEITLKYIMNDTKRFHVYVSNRVGEIRRLTEPDQWHHIPGKENPADVISRGQALADMDKRKWFRGPEFLRKFKSDWTLGKFDDAICDKDPEVKKEPSCNIVTHAAVVEPHPLDMLIEHFSSWAKLRRSVAWLIRLKDILKSKCKFNRKMLSVQEFRIAEIVLLKHVQAKSYKQELCCLMHGSPVNQSSSLSDLCPVLDKDGLLCVGGRLRHAELPNSSKFPIILPHKCEFSEKIASEFHCASHLGIEWTLAQLRQRYWITRARSVLKKVIDRCIRCKRLNASSCHQKMADLPFERVQPEVPAFTFVGLDCFGPFMVKHGRSEVKRYGCIFTCLSIRAVHLEVLDTMTTDSFLNGFRRFVARRGQPTKVWSDNGPNIAAGQTEMAKAFREVNQAIVHDFAVSSNIEWKFNPPTGSHMGGIWERLIRSVRKVLLSLLLDTKQRLTDEILKTLFCEVESILNNRPITKLSSDPGDLTPLTPNHLLVMREGPRGPPGLFSETDMYRRRWRYIQHLTNQFWQRWVKEYLPELQRRQKWSKEKRNFKVNDLVLVCDEGTPRHLWPLALVEDVKEGRDGLVRSLRLKTKSTILVRPVTKVVLLEGA